MIIETKELKKFNIVCKGCNSKKFIKLMKFIGFLELECSYCNNKEKIILN